MYLSSLGLSLTTMAFLVSNAGGAAEAAKPRCVPKNALPFVEREKFDGFRCSKTKGGDLDLQSLSKVIIGSEMVVISQGFRGQKGSKLGALKFNASGTYEFSMVGTDDFQVNAGGSFGMVDAEQIESSHGRFKVLDGGEIQISQPFDSSCKRKIDGNESSPSRYSVEYYSKRGKTLIILHKQTERFLPPFYAIPEYSLFLPIDDVLAKGLSKDFISGIGGNIFGTEPFFAYGCFDDEFETFKIN